MEYHLVQVNVAIARYAYDDPHFAGFVDNLDRIYDLAESLPGLSGVTKLLTTTPKQSRSSANQI